MKATRPLALAALLASAGPAMATCEIFKHEGGSIADFWKHHRGSVVQVVGRGATGTAFLIDSELGLFLTAGHVAAAAASDGTLTLRSEIHHNRPDVKAAVVAIETNDETRIDVALLRIEGDNLFRDEAEIDLSFDTAGTWNVVGFLGGSKSSDVARLDPRETRSVNRFAAKNGTYYALDASTGRGDSGAPAIIEGNALASGLIIRNETINTAILLPGPTISAFLERHALEPSLEFESLSPQFIVETFQASPPNKKRYSNWRLMGFLRKLDKMAEEARTVERELIETSNCPLIEIARARQLNSVSLVNAAMIMSRLVSVDLRGLGKRMFEIAETMDESGNSRMAGEIYRGAAEMYANAVRASFPAEFSGTAENGLFLLSAYGADRLAALSFDGKQSNTLSALALDYQVALTRAHARGDPVVSAPESPYFAEVILASALGVTVAAGKHWEAVHFQEAASAFAAEGEYDNASGAYAAAWEKGLTKFNVKQGFDFTVKMVAGGPPGGIAGITVYQPLTGIDLYTAAGRRFGG